MRSLSCLGFSHSQKCGDAMSFLFAKLYVGFGGAAVFGRSHASLVTVQP